jgi:hypothetical protein
MTAIGWAGHRPTCSHLGKGTTSKGSRTEKSSKPKPRKPALTKRWTVRIDPQFRGSLDYDGEQVGYLRMSNVDNAHVVAQLNRYRVTLRAPKARTKGKP